MQHLPRLRRRKPGNYTFFNDGMLFAVQQGPTARSVRWSSRRGKLMDPKLTILFMLIACIIGLSHVSELSFGRVRRLLPTQRLRSMMSGRRRV
jgi:hypothetical protein